MVTTDAHMSHGKQLFNRTWELLDMEDRTPDQDAEMATAALASRYHWRQVGEARNFAISDWQASRVFSTLGAAEVATTFGRLCLRLCEDNSLGPFLTGSAHEALARSARLAGNKIEFETHLELAKKLLARVEDDEERELLSADIDAIS